MKSIFIDCVVLIDTDRLASELSFETLPVLIWNSEVKNIEFSLREKTRSEKSEAYGCLYLFLA